MLAIKKASTILWAFCLCLFFVCCDFSKETPPSQNSLIDDTSENDSVVINQFGDIKIDSLNTIALEYWQDGDYQKSLSIINLAYSKAEKEGNDTELAKILNTLGLVHWRLGNNED